MPKDEAAAVADLRYGWRRLRRTAAELSDRLARLQVGYKSVSLGLLFGRPIVFVVLVVAVFAGLAQPVLLARCHTRTLTTQTKIPNKQKQRSISSTQALTREVAAFVVDAAAFRREWDAHGPTVPGLEPQEAVDRLKKYGSLFDARKRRWDACAAGEALFGLPVTPFPELEATEREIAALDKLYRFGFVLFYFGLVCC